MTENSDGGATVITIAALAAHPRNAADYWKGAQIRWRRWSWWFETRPISAYNPSGILSLAGQSIIHIMGTKGWGFYIDNKLEELDAPGEWWYDAAAKKVYFHPPRGADPNSMLVEAACRSSGVELAGGIVDNICFRHQNRSGISLARTSTVTNCRFEGIGSDSGGSALRATWDIANSNISHNVFENNLNIGISWYENSGRLGSTVIEYDTLINTGTFPGYGGSGTWHAVGILVHLSSGVTVQYNYIDKTGYAGILLGSDGNIVQYNSINGAMWTLNDGAAVYTNCSKSTIRNNIISDTKGDLESSGPWYPLAHGIWLEFLGDYRESLVENNTIVRSGCNGIYLPNNFSCTIRNNVLFDNAVAQLELSGEESNSSTGRTQNLAQNNQITGNVCYATSRMQQALQFRSQYDYGTMQGNYFCNPYTDSVVSGYGTGNSQWTMYDYTLSQWNQKFAWADKTAKTDPFKRPAGLSENNPFGKGRILINDSPTQREFALGAAAYTDLDGNPIQAALSLSPFTSRIIVQKDSTLETRAAGPAENYAHITRLGAGFQYRIDRKCSVAFEVFTQSGRMIYHVPDIVQNPGMYTITWGQSTRAKGGSAQGIYTCLFRVTTEGTVSQWNGKILTLR
jgi:parallel beta-helix repeat protein